jgi:hypothetical protein
LHILHKLVLLLVSVALCPAISWAQDLLVSVRERSGEPLTAEAFVRVTWQGRGQALVGTTGGLGNEVSTASFQVEAGEYDIEVEAAGYDNPAQAPGTTPPGKSANSLNVPADASFFAKLTTPIVITQAKPMTQSKRRRTRTSSKGMTFC